MKKVLSTLAVGLMAVSAFAQGTVNFSSGAILTKLESGTAVPSGGGQVQFGWAAVGTAFVPWTVNLTAEAWIGLNPGWSIIGNPANIAPVAGRFSGGTLTAATSAAGAIVQGIVIGWTGTGRADFLAGYSGALAQGPAGQFGVTSPFTVDTGDPTVSPAGTPGAIGTSTATPFTGLTLSTIPEPSSFALAGLGAAALMIFRRRK